MARRPLLLPVYMVMPLCTQAPGVSVSKAQSDWIRAHLNGLFNLITSMKAFSANIITLWGTRG